MYEQVVRSSWENHLFRFHCANHSEKPLKAKIVSAMASTIFESSLHCTISESKEMISHDDHCTLLAKFCLAVS